MSRVFPSHKKYISANAYENLVISTVVKTKKKHVWGQGSNEPTINKEE
jgi:hypothetical protein